MRPTFDVSDYFALMKAFGLMNNSNNHNNKQQREQPQQQHEQQNIRRFRVGTDSLPQANSVKRIRKEKNELYDLRLICYVMRIHCSQVNRIVIALFKSMTG